MKGPTFKTTSAKFSIGDLVYHKLFDYRGVIVDIDAEFQLSDAWYDAVARSRPPKDEPWYHVLVDNAINATYVAEQNLTSDRTGVEISHPMIGLFFIELRDGRYIKEDKVN